MKDFFGKEIQIGDRCIRYNGSIGGLEEIIVLGEDNKGLKILNYLDKEVYTTGTEHKLFNLSAFERQIHSETFINSVKTLDIKPDSTVVASFIPNQLPMNNAKSMYKQLKKAFPDNKIVLIMGLDITIDDVMEHEEIIKGLVEWVEEENKKAQKLYEFRNSQVHFNLKNHVGKKDYTMSEEQWKRFRQVWESDGVNFQNDDGTYKSIYEVLCEMSSVWQKLNEENQNEIL